LYKCFKPDKLKPNKLKMIRILAIDDKNDNLISLKALIKESFPDALLFTALSGLKGIEIAVDKDPDVILLDVVMPGMDGFEVCRRLKQDKLVYDIPVVFITALKEDKETRIKALEAGAEAFLSKPIDETELTAQLRAMVKIKIAGRLQRDEKERLVRLVAERTQELQMSQTAILNLLDDLKAENENRKKTEGILRKSEAKFRALITQMQLGLAIHEIILDENGNPVNYRFIDVNPSFEKLTGLKRKDIIGKTVLDVMSGTEKYWIEKYGHVALSGEPLSYENYASELGKYYNVVAYRSREKEFAVVIEDITERKLAAQAIEETNKKLFRAQSLAHIGNWENYLPTGELQWSDEMYQIMGLSPGIPVKIDEAISVFPPEELKKFEKAVSEAIMEGIPYSMDYRIIRPDGSVRYIHDEGEVIRDVNGNATWMIGTTQDISWRKLSEMAIIEREEFLSSIIENIPHMIFIKDAKDLNFIRVNRSAEILFGHQSDEIIGKNDYDFFPKEQADFFTHKDRVVLKSGKMEDISEEPLETPMGTRILHTKKIPISDNLGNPLYLLGISEDITEKKLFEDALRESEEKFRSIAEQSSDLIALSDNNGIITYASPASIKLFMVKPDKMVGHHFSEFIVDEEIQKATTAFRITMQYSKNMKNLEWKMKRKDGSIFFGELSGSSFIYGSHKGILVIIRDITARKRAEETLRISEERFRYISSSISDISYSCVSDNGEDLHISWMYGATEQITGYSIEEMFSMKCWGKIVLKDDFPVFQKHILEVPPGSSSSCELRLQNKNGSRIWVEATAKCIADQNKPGTIYTYGGITNITERKASEKIIRENEERFRLITQNISDSVWLMDNYFNTVWISPSVVKTRGYSLKELQNMSLDENITEDSLQGMLSRIITEITPENLEDKNWKFSVSGELEYYCKNGSTVWIDTIISLIRDSEGRPSGFLGVGRDITEKMQLQEQLRKLSRAIEQSSVSVVITDKNGYIEFVNPKFSELTGYTFNEAVGQKPSILKTGHTSRNEYKILWDTIISGKVWKGELLNKKKNGTTYWESAIISPVTNDYGIITHFVAVKEDITENKKIEEALLKSELNFRNLYENAPVPYQSVNEKAIIIDVNPKWLETMGYQREEVIGKSFINFLPKDQRYQYMNVFSKMKKDGYVKDAELRLLSKTGKMIDVLLEGTVNKADDGKFNRTYTTFKDITQEKQLEKVIAGAIIESEEGQRAIFAADLHDSLGPMLSSIKLYLKSQENRKKKEDIEALGEKVNDILDESIRIIRELSLNLSPHILSNHGLNEAMKDFINRVVRDGVNIHYKSNVTERLDSKYEVGIYRVLTELINNTLKHSQAKTVRIKLNMVQKRIDMIFSDNGKGFDVTSVLKSNTGNGLYNIINRMKAFDSKYEFISSPGNGLKFLVTINLV